MDEIHQPQFNVLRRQTNHEESDSFADSARSVILTVNILHA